MLDNLKIALVCDWLTVHAGAERVLYEMHMLFPNAPIYTSIYNKNACSEFKNAKVKDSALRYVPGAKKMHKLFLPFMPGIFERLDLSEYDLVISSNHSASKGIITKPETLHVSYCHSPMRYVWDRSHSYLKGQKNFALLRPLYKPMLHKLRLWDRIAADRVDHCIANSEHVSARIKKYYGRESEVILPPVDLTKFSKASKKEDYYLAVGRLIPYKRFDLVVQACESLGRPLKIIGSGSELSRLKKMAGPYTEFLENVTDEELSEFYQGAKALIFPQLEDFGIVPLEAMASGTPVIAYGAGGALETVVEGKSGLFFKEQTVKSLSKAIKEFEKKKWPIKKVADTVSTFSNARFRSELNHSLENAWKEHVKMLA
ncbi:glycosyltransferase [Candidatus Peregrinibacteria bacterium]|jgi:glycosyltransferase involved in cell wall biosynthesis|nr:glycosyltransferase [Candidatus Peregrinibacteria bacterium]MBT4631869.1 glycosyltransferase [Candidatus Peregrinibacteria bacterium]MBT5824210.1 glycosyltransferase [Candidatus Peregrinibacteria bacterium]